MPGFIRALVGLDRAAAMAAFNEALAGRVLSATQIDFVEMIVDRLTASARMEPGLLYTFPFTDTAPTGVSDVFALAQVEKIVSTIRAFEPRLEVA